MFVKDLFPLGPGSQPERAELVAEQLHKSMSSRTGIMPDDLAELIRIAGEWQGGVKPSQGVLARLQGRTPPRPAGGDEFRACAQDIARRRDLLDENGWWRPE